MKALLISLPLLFATLLPQPAAALYISAGGGVVLLQDSDLDLQDETLAEIGFDSGALFFGAVGVEPFRGLRLELELAHRSNGNDRLVDRSNPALPVSEEASGDMTVGSLMVNAAFDLPLGRSWRPYIAGGIGVADVALELRGADGLLLFDDQRQAFAYQAQVGAAYLLGDGLSLFVGYRYFATEGLKMSAVGGLEFEMDYDSHSLEGGLRFSF